MNKIEKLFDIKYEVDHKNKLNRASNMSIPLELIESIEKEGITSENLDKIEFPIFKYHTQITMHGIPERRITERILGYKYIVNNKNKSIGIKYDTIDKAKKNYIAKIIRNSEPRYFAFNKNTLYKNTLTNSLEETVNIVKEYKEKIELIKNACQFYGNFNCFISNSFMGTFVCLEININAIYQIEVWKLLSTITNFKNEDEWNTYIIEKEKREKIENEKLTKEWEEERIKRINESKPIYENAINNDKNPIINLENIKKDFIGYYYTVDKDYSTNSLIAIKKYVHGYFDKTGKLIIQRDTNLEKINKRMKKHRLIIEKLKTRKIFLMKEF